MERTTLFDSWDRYRVMFRRADVPPPVVELLRQAFYAGAVAAHWLVSVASLQCDIAPITALQEELHAFRYDVGTILHRDDEDGGGCVS